MAFAPPPPRPAGTRDRKGGGEGCCWWCPCRLTSLPPSSLGALCFLPLPWKQQSMRALKRDGNEGGNIPAPHPGGDVADKGISVSPTTSEDELSREISGEIGWWKNASTASFPSPDLGFRRNQSCRAEVSGLGIFRGEKAVANADPVRRGSTGRIFSGILVEICCSIPTSSIPKHENVIVPFHPCSGAFD